MATATGGVLPVEIVAVDIELLSVPSLTTSPTIYVPATSAAKLAIGERRLKIVAALLGGVEISDQV